MSDGSSLSPLPRSETLTDRVYAAIRAAIVGGDLPAGSTVSVPAVAKQLGVSATPVREALMHLREAGLVSLAAGGFVVAVPSEHALREAHELREVLEGMAAALAAERADADEVAAIERLAHKSVDDGKRPSADRFRETDRAFHAAVSDGAHNELLSHYLANARDLAWALRDIHWSSVPFAADAADGHVAVAEAIANRDASEAESQMREHIRGVLERTLAAQAAATAVEADATA
jgi:DNA-binding GntR family transcriptional regulator